MNTDPYSQTPSFEYGALNQQPEDTIRLLTIQNGESDFVHCRVSLSQLRQSIVYVALSYMWDEGPADMSLLIAGKPFSVRRDLYSFLKRLQREKEPTCVGIDAICIDQSDVTERSHQLGLMGQIYRGAELVSAWVGDDTIGITETLRCGDIKDYLERRYGPANHPWIMLAIHLCLWNDNGRFDQKPGE